MKNVTITMEKKGTIVTLFQNSNGYFANINGEISIVKDATELNTVYTTLKAKGWSTVLEAPKKAEKKTREEALTEKYGDKEHRREYCKIRDSIRFEVADEIRQWTKTHRRLTKEEYKKVWNNEVNKRLQQRMAEAVAISG